MTDANPPSRIRPAPGQAAARAASKALRYYQEHGFRKFSRRVAQRLRQIARKQFHRATGRPTVRTDYGVLMRANWDDKTFEFCVNADYGYFFSDYLSNVQPPFVFLDIGANQGLYSLIAARNPNCLGVTAFEPVAGTFALLTQNIGLNRQANRIRPVNAALSAQDGALEIATSAGHSGAASIDFPASYADTKTEQIALLGAEAIAGHIPRSGMIVAKIDTEGHEEVVIGALMRCAIAARIDAILYEIDESRAVPERIAATLRDAGFSEFTRIGGGGHYDILALRLPDRPIP